MKNGVLILLTIVLSANAYADDSDVAIFNTAWRDYSAAAASDDVGLRVETAERVVDVGKRVFNESDEQLTIITHNYGVAVSDSGSREDAVPILKEALRLGEIVYGKDGVGLISILADLADAEADVFSPGAQIRYYRRALKIVEEHFGKQGFQYADLAFRAARNVYTMSHSLQVDHYMREARDIYASLPEPATQNVGMAKFYLGKMEFTDRDFRHSSEHLESALSDFESPGDANQAMRLLTRALLVQVYEHRGLTDQATQHCVAIGRESQLSPDQDYAPLFRVPPMYPVSMLRAGKSGQVDLAFTVDENGFVQDPYVIARRINGKERSRSSDFDEAALDAVERFRYAPRFVDGEAVATAGVKTRISFALE
jgi:TonB family protein